MSEQNDIERLTDRLASVKPELENREELIRRVMEITSDRGRIDLFSTVLNFLFSWAYYPWLRRGLATVSLAVVLLFVFQQFTIISRIGDLEHRMVESNTQQLLEHQSENVLYNSLLQKTSDETDLKDSILVADRDLRELIESYSLLQDRYRNLQRKQKRVPGTSDANL